MRWIALVALVLSLGCSTMTERIVNEARKGLAFSGDYTPKVGGNAESLAALVDHFTRDLRIDVEYLPPNDEVLHGAFGISYTAGDHWFIKLRNDISVNGKIEVLAHEAGHLFAPPWLTRPQGDVFAEVVAAHIAKALGVPDTVATSGLWLRQHKAWLQAAFDLEDEIQYVVKILLPGSPDRPAATRR